MNRRAFLAWMAAGVGAVAAVPALGKLEAFAVETPLVLAVDPTVPYWMLELQAYERFMTQWEGARVRGVRRRDIPKLPVKPDVIVRSV